MKVLLTGGTGFVGSAVARQFLSAGYRVRALVRSGGDLRNLIGLPVETVPGDLRDVPSLRRALAGCEGLCHVAADYRLWTPDPRPMYATNVEGTRNLLEAALAAGIERIVYTGSVATLGRRPDGRPADEATPGRLEEMVGHYKRSKFLAVREVMRLVRGKGLPAVLVSPSTPVGARDIRPTPTGRLVVDAAAGRMPAYVDTGLNLVHVDDVAAGHLLAFERGRIGENYILGGEDMSLRDILAAVARAAGRSPPRLRLPRRLVLPFAFVTEGWARLPGRGEPRLTLAGIRMAKHRMYFSSAKAVGELGYRPRPVESAIEEAVVWFRKYGYCR